MKPVLFSLVFFISVTTFSQVGIGTTTPDASAELHVDATDKGVLVSRMTEAQKNDILNPAEGLLIYQTNNTPGFYYYTGSGWDKITNDANTIYDHDFFIEGTSTPSLDINDNIYTLGNLNIGTPSTGLTSRIYINNPISAGLSGLRLVSTGDDAGSIGYGVYNQSSVGDVDRFSNYYNAIGGSSNAIHRAIENQFDNTGTGTKTAIYNEFNLGAREGGKIGVENRIEGGDSFVTGVKNQAPAAWSVDGDLTGVENDLDAPGDGLRYGVKNTISSSATGLGTKYGIYNTIDPGAGGTHYGIYSNVPKAGSYAGYFLGNVSFGSTSANNYVFPPSRGINGQVMQTDGSGNVSWQTPLGDIASVNAGTGLTGGATSGSATINAVATNGLSHTANDIRLGGNLVQSTTIYQGNNNMAFNLTGIGDFAVLDSGVPRFQVNDNGNVSIDGNLLYANASSNRVGVNLTSPSSTLDVNGQITIRGGAPTAGRVLTALNSTGLASWQPPSSSTDHDWYELNSTNAPNSINDLIYTQGRVSIGSSSSTDGALGVYSSTSKSIHISNAYNGTKTGIYINLSGTTPSTGVSAAINTRDDMNGTQNKFGIYQTFSGINTNTSTATTGMRNWFTSSSDYRGSLYGVYNYMTSNQGTQTGTYNYVDGSGSGQKYASYNYINSSAGGLHYGVYSNVQKSTGFAGFFIGKTSFGTSPSTGRYLMPTADGTSGQVMVTNGSGQLLFVNNNAVGTDDQDLTAANLAGTNLNITIENGSSVTADLSGLQDVDWHESSNTPPNSIDDHIFTNGRVGINIDTPAYELDVVGDINTTGDIRKTGGAYSYPDYVFEKYYDGFSEYHNTYRHRSLAEIEAFVKKHKHLPGIQSRNDIIKNGWIITEGVKDNLEKIEELFLYTFELKKENKSLKQELMNQKSEMEDLKNQLKKIEAILHK